MAWKLRKDKLKAGAPEAETPTEIADAPAPVVTQVEKAPVFDLSGSAFQSEPAVTEEEPAIPSFIEDTPPLGIRAPSTHTGEVEAEPIELEPLPTIHSKPEPFTEASSLPEPLPEFDPLVAPEFGAEPDEIAVAPLLRGPETETAAPPALSTEQGESDTSYQNLTPEREAIAFGLVTTQTETGLPRVAPFILDTPAAAVTPEPPRMHSVVIRIGKLSATHFLTKDVTTIGRPDGVVQNYPDIEIELDDGVSRRHAEIRHDDAGYTLADVGSTNGTVLNGEMLTANQPVPLQPGDQIRVGERTELLFE